MTHYGRFLQPAEAASASDLEKSDPEIKILVGDKRSSIDTHSFISIHKNEILPTRNPAAFRVTLARLIA